MKQQKKLKIFKMLSNILYKNEGNVLCQLQEKCSEQKFKCQKN